MIDYLAEMAFIVDLQEFGGATRLKAKGYKIYAQTKFGGD